MQRRKVFVVVLLHFLSSGTEFGQLFDACLAICIAKGPIEISKIDVLRLDGIEEFLRGRSLLQKLPMLVVGEQAGGKNSDKQRTNHDAEFLFLLLFDMGEGLTELQEACKAHMERGKFLVTLGGEHSLTQAPVKAAREVAQPAGVDRAHLIDEHARPGSVHLDLWPEDRCLRAGGSRGDDQRGEQDPVTLDRDGVPRAALLMPGGVLARAQPEQVITQ